ncbi:unnamed protein product [Blepharisma stoltei]|uniref:Amino acid transporter transmembrane domain-containing protein n=1 Tax=Blepharisma stoltei TaxID=1481888 RepID=A0AAU9III9_9CILI|nr:unnamed protein product [Blepharisma stoltei]
MSIMDFSIEPSSVNPDKFGLSTGYFFSVNIVVGAGFLALPHAFKTSGWLISFFYMIFTAYQSYYLARQLLEVMSRTEVIVRLREEGKKVKPPTWRQILTGQKAGEDLLEKERTPRPIITSRRFDVTENIRILFGQKWATFYIIILSFYFQGAQLGYVSIFASSFASNIPLPWAKKCDIYETSSYSDSCYENYWIFLIIYAVFMTYLTIKGMKEQRWVQSVLTIMRFIIIGLVLITSIALLIQQKQVDHDVHESFDDPPLAVWTHLSSMASIILFAFVYQIQFPSIAEFVRSRVKNLKRIIIMVAATSFTLYAMLGIIVPMAIHDVKGEVNISFREYSAGYSQSDRPWWTYIIAYIIVLFPAFDVFSSFPLMAIPLSDNVLTMRYGIGETKNLPFKTVAICRFLCVVLPFSIAFFVYDLSIILNWVGLFGFILVPIAIPLMHIAAREMVETPSPYDVKFSSRRISLAIVGFNSLIMLYVLVNMIVVAASSS